MVSLLTNKQNKRNIKQLIPVTNLNRADIKIINNKKKYTDETLAEYQSTK